MSKVSEDKMQLRIQRWKELLKNCKESGLTVKEWTSKNNIGRPAVMKSLKSLYRISPDVYA